MDGFTFPLRLIPGRPGLRVLDPVQGRPIPEDGSFEIREMSTYWFRALQCGDAKVFKDQPPEAACAAEEAISTPISENQAGGAKQ